MHFYFVKMFLAETAVYDECLPSESPGRVAQSVARLIHEPDVPASIPGPPHTFVAPSLNRDGHEVLVNRLGGLCYEKKCG